MSSLRRSMSMSLSPRRALGNTRGLSQWRGAQPNVSIGVDLRRRYGGVRLIAVGDFTARSLKDCPEVQAVASSTTMSRFAKG